MTMLLPIENNRMNNLTMNFMPKGNKEHTKPLQWKNSIIEESIISKRLGLGKFSRMNRWNNDSNDCGNDSAHIDKMTSPITKEEQSSCTPPRRISFNRLDQEAKDINLFPMLQTNNKKTVRFAPQLSTATPDSTKLWNGSLTEEHCNELWYQKSELAAIKHAAKVAIANRAKVERNPYSSFEQLDELLGLERFSKQRAVWKKSAIKCVMMAQCQINGMNGNTSISKEDYIERISSRCTAWARDAAEKQGFHDYCAVHDPLAALFSDSEDTYNEKENKQNYNELIFGERTISNKRGCNELDTMMIDSGRRKRHRASPSLVL